MNDMVNIPRPITAITLKRGKKIETAKDWQLSEDILRYANLIILDITARYIVALEDEINKVMPFDPLDSDKMQERIQVAQDILYNIAQGNIPAPKSIEDRFSHMIGNDLILFNCAYTIREFAREQLRRNPKPKRKRSK